MKLKIEMDDRGHETMRKILESCYEVEVKRLSVGDVRTEEVIIELKTFNDFVSSIIDGRLFRQLNKLVEKPKPYFCVVYGKAEWQADVKPEVVYGAIASLAVRYYPASVIFVPATIAHAGYVIAKIIKKASEGKLMKPRRVYKRPIRKVPPLVEKVQKLFSVPSVTAAKLLLKFHSIQAICFAREEDLRKIPGIGSVRAKRIHSLVRKKV